MTQLNTSEMSVQKIVKPSEALSLSDPEIVKPARVLSSSIPEFVRKVIERHPGTFIDELCNDPNIQNFLNFMENKYSKSTTINCYVTKYVLMSYKRLPDNMKFSCFRPHIEIWNKSSDENNGNLITINFNGYCIKGDTIVFNINTVILRDDATKHIEREFDVKFHDSEISIEYIVPSCKHTHIHEKQEFFNYIENIDTIVI